jgi:hypothetical protein
MLQKGTTATPFVIISGIYWKTAGSDMKNVLKTVGLHPEAIHEELL